MQKDNKIERLRNRYLLQSLGFVSMLCVAVFAISFLLHIEEIVKPLIVGVVFASAAEVADVSIWFKVSNTNKEYLPTFFMAISGFRLVFILTILLVCYLAVGRDAMLGYCLVLMLFYLAVVLHHSLFFASILNSHTVCDNIK